MQYFLDYSEPQADEYLGRFSAFYLFIDWVSFIILTWVFRSIELQTP